MWLQVVDLPGATKRRKCSGGAPAKWGNFFFYSKKFVSKCEMCDLFHPVQYCNGTG